MQIFLLDLESAVVVVYKSSQSWYLPDTAGDEFSINKDIKILMGRLANLVLDSALN